MWKGIYKTALIEEQIEIESKLNNHPNFAHLHIISIRLPEQLIPTISTNLIFEAVTSHFLDILPSNSDFIIVCNCIYLFITTVKPIITVDC